MQQIITLSGTLTASNTDVLNNTRLQTVPTGGVMTIEVGADLNNATNNFVVSVSLPDGQTPFEAIAVPATNPALDGVLDSLQSLKANFPVAQGGHVVLNLTESGTAIAMFRVTFTPV